ncbi:MULTISPECIES: autotransporter outer membrane beta-barrel domain-containing protein [Serratia]|uniref:autotransporter outer membrane beta-barrel domain-containing protein n=2 Tax=Serratia TaxID=613 RepID=UPI00223FCC79|nr:autotransporter outer membrane beta-barrel domain-containing protein [Serratia bockelmannii]MCW7606414.1 autotransporter outer membrane beta-barrel domain-containing protein [Serratia bockelmannii]
MVNKISSLAIYTSIALFQANTYSFAAQSPISIPLGHLEDRLTINVGVNGGPAQKYVFDTGSDQFNAALGQQDTSRLPNVNQAYDYLYGSGNNTWGGYWLQRKQVTSLTYYTSDDNPTPVVTPDSNDKGYVVGQIEHFLSDKPVPKEQLPFKKLGDKFYYIDLAAEKALKAGKPIEEKYFYGTFGVGDFLFKDAKDNPNGGSPFATVTSTGFIVAGNDNSGENGKTLSPGCAPCSILHLTPSLRAQFDTLVPWAPTRDEGDITHFPNSGAPASSQHEGQFKYAFTLNINGKESKIDLPGEALSGAILFDTGNPSHVTIDSQKLGDILEKNGVKFSGDEAKTARIVDLTLQPVDVNGQKVGNGLLLTENSDQDLLVINKDGSDKNTWNMTLGIGFFLQYAVMYDLQNQLTAFSPFFISADNFSTDADGREVQLNRITKQMGNLMPASAGDPSVDASGKKGFLGLAGVISGNGPLTLMSDVVVNMTGVNTYTGATHINKGAVLYLTGPGSIARSSRVENNGWFDITGHGSYYSEWRVPDGMNDATIRSLSGNGVVTLGDRTLILSQARDNFSGRITDVVLGDKEEVHNKGGVTIAGGNQMLSGDSDYTGQTIIARGAALHLAGTGSLVSDVVADGAFIADGKATGAVAVGDGGLVGGNGRIGALAAHSGGTVSPGNSIGTLTIDNNLTLETGSRYLAEVEAGRSDLLQVNGQATLNGGEISVVPGAGRNLLATPDIASNILAQRYTVLNAGQGVTGQFGSARAGLFLTPDVLYQPNSVTLGLQRNTTRFAEVANTPNQRNLATAIEHLPVNHSVYQSLLVAPSVEQARQAYRQLSGQVHADIASASVNNSRYVRDTLNGRLRQAQGATDSGEIKQDEQGAWVSLLGNWAHASGNDNAAGFHDSTFGVLLGADSELANKWRLGLATGYTRTSLHGNSASADSDNYHLAFYTGKSYDNLNLRAGTAYTWHRIETSRSVGYYGQSSSDKAHYGAGTGQVFAEAGYRLNAAWVNMEPFANLAWVNYKSNGFNEHGGASALSGESQSTSATLSTFGLRADKRWSMGKEHAVTLRGEMGWQHQYNHPEREVGLRFAGSDATFNTATVAASRDGMVMKAGAQVNVGETIDVSLSYTGLLSENYQDNGVTAGIQWRF